MSLYNRLVYRTVALLFLWAVGFGLARADSATDTLDQVARCSAIADSTERLKCFDRVAPAAKDAQLPKAADFGKPVVRVPEVAQIVATVRQMSKTVRGRAVLIKPYVQMTDGTPLSITGQDDYPGDYFLDSVRIAPH